MGVKRSVPITGIIGTNPLAQFADWKLAGDEAGLKGEAYLLQKELIRKDAFPYQCQKIVNGGVSRPESRGRGYRAVRAITREDRGGAGLVAPKARGGHTRGMTAPDDIAILRIELEDIKPLIWRRVGVRHVDDLKAVHDVIQTAWGGWIVTCGS